MESPNTRMPIACVACAKAKAKCDKKVPCGRCVQKQIVCEGRATRRASNHQNRRNGMPRPQAERSLTTSFHLADLVGYSGPATNGPMMSPTHISPQHMQHPFPPPVPPPYAVTRNMSVPNIHYAPAPIAPAPYVSPDTDFPYMSGSQTQTPPDLQHPVTPMMPNMPPLDLSHLNHDGIDHYANNQHMGLHGPPDFSNFDSGALFPDFNDPQSMFTDFNDHMGTSGLDPKFMQPPEHPHNPLHGYPGMTESSVEKAINAPLSELHIQRTRRPLNNSSLSPSASIPSSAGLPTPSTSIPSAVGMVTSSAGASPAAGMLEPDAVSQSLTAWPFFQPNQIRGSHSRAIPKTAHIYMDGLSNTLRSKSTWTNWTDLHANLFDGSDSDQVSKILVAPFEGYQREELVAITQTFLHKALSTHKRDRATIHAGQVPPSPSRGDEYLMLPPPQVLQYFLQNYAVRYEPYYPLVSACRLDPNELIGNHNITAAGLLILLMVAAGAAAIPTVEARYIASGLTETCRLSLFDSIEKDVMNSRDPLVLRSALLFVCLGVWSGDKWHMDMAMGQRGTYMSMVSHTGLLGRSDDEIHIDEIRRNPEESWAQWRDHESRHRLAHAWICIDQEISLFSEETPRLSIIDLHTPMPAPDDLWQAASAREWLEAFEKTHGSSYKTAISVRDMFTKFVDGEFEGQTLSPMQLRLLLHPLHAQVCQHRQYLACLPGGGVGSRSRAATRGRLEDISSLLQQWYTLCKDSFTGDKRECWTTCANLIMYHLISLNVITSFKDIEEFARKDAPVSETPANYPYWLQARCIDNPGEVYFHCGQIFRLVRSWPKTVRPPWWPGAVYRAALTVWATSMADVDGWFVSNNSPDTSGSAFIIDQVTPKAYQQYSNLQQGTPMLTSMDFKVVPLNIPTNVIEVSIELLEDDCSMRLAGCIRSKLAKFLELWKDV